MSMPHTPVQSSFIRSVGHDSERNIMEVKLKNGQSYQYEGVDSDTFESVRDAESVGKAYNEFVRNR